MRTRGHAEVVVVFFSEDLRPLLHVALRVRDLHVVIRVGAAPGERDDMIKMPGAADLLLADPADAPVACPDYRPGDILDGGGSDFRPAFTVVISYFVRILYLPGVFRAFRAMSEPCANFRTAGSAGSAHGLGSVMLVAEPPPVWFLPA